MRTSKSFAIAGTVLFLTLNACQHQQPEPKSWTTEDVVGLSIELIHPTRIENYNFLEEVASGKTYVAATLGTEDGPVTGPLLEWHIVDGRLWIGDNRMSTEFVLLSRTRNRLIVEKPNGSISEFKINSQ